MLCQHGAETQAPATLVSLREAELAREQARVAQREAERARAVKAFLLRRVPEQHGSTGRSLASAPGDGARPARRRRAPNRRQLAIESRDSGSTRAELATADANATDDSLRALARVRGRALLDEARLDEAAATLEASVAELRAHRPRPIPRAQLLPLMAAVQTAQGRYGASAAALDEGLQLWAADGGRAVDPATFDVYQLERGRLSLALRRCGQGGARRERIAVGEGGRHPPLDHLAAQLVLAHASALDARWDDALAYAGAVVTTVDSWPHPEHFPRLHAEALALVHEAEPHVRAIPCVQP